MAKKILKSSKKRDQCIGDDEDNHCSGKDSSQQESSNQTSPNKIIPSPIINYSPALPGVQQSACESHIDSQPLVCESDVLSSVQIQAESEQSNNSHRQQRTRPRNNNSNNSFKKCCTPIKKLVRKYLKVKISPYQKLYYKKSYFMFSLLLLQSKFCLSTEKFSQLLDQYINHIKKLELKEDGLTSLSRQYLEYFEIGIKTFRLYNQGRILQSIKTFYKFQTMKQKGNLKEAIKQYEQERKKLQMEDLQLMNQYKNEQLSSENQFNNSNQQQIVELPHYHSFSSCESNLFEANLEANDEILSLQANSIYDVLDIEGQSEVYSNTSFNFCEQEEI